MSKLLFENKVRTRSGPSKHNESNKFHYYDSSDRKDVEAVRNLLNKWFLKYPSSEQNELRSRFEATFSSAYYELFIHELFISQGFEMHVHPSVPNSSKRPDFLGRKGSCEIYIEAKEATDKTAEEEALENKVNQFYDGLDTMHAPNFVVCITEVRFKTNKQPGTKVINAYFEQEMRKYDPDVVRAEVELDYDKKPRVVWDKEDVFLEATLMPKSKEMRENKEIRPIGMFPFRELLGGKEESVEESLRKKANRYKALDKPYIVCINVPNMIGNTGFDLQNTLWGSVGYNNKGMPIRVDDGIFKDQYGPQFRNVSGILINKVFDSNVAHSEYWFTKHPFATNPLDFDIFELAHEYLDNDKITSKPGRSISDLLNVPSNWLSV